jgi:D-inositol-3-phosphate glycosyltransferase
MIKKKLLWVGDAVVPTGFARVTHNVAKFLKEDFDVTVVGIGYNGDPHPYDYPIYPAKTRNSEDQWGVARMASIVAAIQPDVIVINNDPWNVIRFPEAGIKVPIIGYMPVDAPNMLNNVAKRLNQLASSIFYTQFGLDTARMAGYTGSATVVPHGVDTKFYRPIDKREAREVTGHAMDSFVVGNINRNQPRKRLDLSIMAFARWVQQYDLPSNVFLHLHCGLLDCGWDLQQLASFFNVSDRVWWTCKEMHDNIGISEEALPFIYNSFDVQISTSFGEGWGLTTMEGMACGVPQIVPDWAALAEWPRGAVRYVPISGMIATGDRINSLGGIADESALVKELNGLYNNRAAARFIGNKGRDLVTQKQFTWESVSERLSAHITDVLAKVGANPSPSFENGCNSQCDSPADGLNAL